MAAKLIVAQAVDYSGNVLSGALLNIYDAGTSTRRSIYATSSLGTSVSNPVAATSDGAIAVWIDDTAGDFKAVLTDSTGTSVYFDQDNIDPTQGNLLIYPLGGSDQRTGTTVGVTFASIATSGDIDVSGDLSVSGSVEGQFSHTFFPVVDGAVSRSLFAKVAERVSVKDFGAVGNNSNDDAPAIQAAITYVSDNGGGVVYFPKGNYKLESTLVVSKDGVVLQGEAADVGRNSWGQQPVNLIWAGAASSSMVEIGDALNPGVARGGRLLNLTLNANNTSNVRPWLARESCSDWSIEHVVVRNMSGLGCYNERGCFAWTYSNCHWFNHDQCPGLILSDDNHNATFINCRTRGTGITPGTPSAIQIGDGPGTGNSNVNFYGCDFESENCDVQIDARAVRALTIVGGYQEIPVGNPPLETAFIRLGHTADNTGANGVLIEGVYFQGGGHVDHVLDIEQANAVQFGAGCHVRNLLDAVIHTPNACENSRAVAQIFVENDPGVNGGVTPPVFSAGSNTLGWLETTLTGYGGLTLNKTGASPKVRLQRDGTQILELKTDDDSNGHVTSNSDLIVGTSPGGSLRTNTASDLGESANPWASCYVETQYYLGGTALKDVPETLTNKTLSDPQISGDMSGTIVFTGTHGREYLFEGAETTNNTIAAYLGFGDNRLNKTNARTGGGRGSTFQNGYWVLEVLKNNILTEVMRADENGNSLVGPTTITGDLAVTGKLTITADPGITGNLEVDGDTNLRSGHVYRIAGTQVVGAQEPFIADVSLTSPSDNEKLLRDAVNAILDALRNHGLISSVAPPS